jgi:hypothetical protein
MTCQKGEHLWQQFWRGAWRCVICGAFKVTAPRLRDEG